MGLSTVLNFREKTSAYYTKHQSWNQNMQNPPKRRFICMTIFFFLLLAIFLKVQLVQYSAIWENCSNRSTQAWASPSRPSYTSFIVSAAQQWVASLGERMAAAGLLPLNNPSELHSCPFVSLLIPGKVKLQTGCVFHGECQVRGCTKASWDCTSWEFLVQKCILHFQVPKFREMQKVKTHYL